MNTALPRPTQKLVGLYVSATDAPPAEIAAALARKWTGTEARRRVNASAIKSAHRNIAALEGRIAGGANAQRGAARLAELNEELRLRTAADAGDLLAALTTT